MTTDMYQPMLPLWDEPPAECRAPQATADEPDAPPPPSGLPPIITAEHVTGPLGMHMLIRLGILIPLDDVHAYRREDGESLYGRAAITAAALPTRITAMTVCGATAAWVWHGGDFPTTVDILSSSHHRTRVFGRPIRTRARRVPADQITTIGTLSLTTPERTACDLALSPIEEIRAHSWQPVIADLMKQYDFGLQPCLNILDGCSYLHTAKQARAVLTDFACAV
ncbi:hypothetical protein [Bifidobacterium pseudolongum]|uniref:AbiEi antitoxin C-terminal domain-containing protein n=1 Tax=Bifidobacterium pseudolongum subsp. pseudolongum TaxID=31954 RepID=A0A4Q5A579_9BIFI|nr:hypothetical protein [Bifidobacterium pseudolongum]KFI78944.1 hypothetical protein BPSP_1315 [Bifidobacterium pseudolongum subsp. pseudolongum]MDY3689862.1 hypothetical protein [Bifidobacterium pseudolongum]PKU99828.1 hypothetical protein CQR52_1270 [Bifidobacterium pseudolongum subsp. pseudolongum]PKV06938.1 hypothetical protein CQR49_1523 [Bifidobacterium pseudolongum subsp. pseudolongum]RYQ19232.1 hypothetical protein PG2054B_1507 [Bifidobacterium pseudolongum subsp. pseudolongum]